MGADTAIAVLSDRPRLLYDYFTQLFAQVTNPPLDAIREELVTSLRRPSAPRPTCSSRRRVVPADRAPMPVIDNDDLAKLLYVNEDGETPGFRAFAIDGLFEVPAAGRRCAGPSSEVCGQVSAAIAEGANIIVLSDRNSNAELGPHPLAAAGLSRPPPSGPREDATRVGLVVETGDAREVHHMALLIGFGAAAVNPYLAFETIDDMIASGMLAGVSPARPRRTTSRRPARAS